MKFGPYLKQLRLKAGLTQSDLARKCGLSDAYINRIENRVADPPPREMCKVLARALGTDELDLWKYAFAARLDRWLRKQGYKRVPDSLKESLFDNLNHKSSRAELKVRSQIPASVKRRRHM